MRKILFGAAVLLGVLLLSAPGPAADDPPAVTKFGALEKSLILPGWGQISEGRVFKGAAFIAAELACLAGAVVQNGWGNENYDLYKSAADAASATRYRRLVERYDGRRNAFLLAAAAVWAVNLFDMFAIIHKKETAGESPSLSLNISHAAPREIRLSFGCRF